MTPPDLPALTVRQLPDGTHELLLGEQVFWHAAQDFSGFPDWETGLAAARALHATLGATPHGALQAAAGEPAAAARRPAVEEALSAAEVDAALDLLHGTLETLKAFAKDYLPTPALELHAVVAPAADIVHVLQVRDPAFYPRILRGDSSDLAQLAKALPRLQAALHRATARAARRPSWLARLRRRLGVGQVADE